MRWLHVTLLLPDFNIKLGYIYALELCTVLEKLIKTCQACIIKTVICMRCDHVRTLPIMQNILCFISFRLILFWVLCLWRLFHNSCPRAHAHPSARPQSASSTFCVSESFLDGLFDIETCTLCVVSNLHNVLCSSLFLAKKQFGPFADGVFFLYECIMAFLFF